MALVALSWAIDSPFTCSRIYRYHPYCRVHAPRHHSDSFMTPLAHLHDDPAARPSSPPAEPRPSFATLPMEIAGEFGGLKVAAEEGVEEGVDEDAAVERRPIQSGFAALGGHLLAFVTAVWHRCRGVLAATKAD